MNIAQYKEEALKAGYDENPVYCTGSEVALEDFLNFSTIDVDLKKYLAKRILCRSFHGTYFAWPKDVEWFITSFFREYTADPIYSWDAETIKEAVSMVLSDDRSKQTISTPYLFSVIENYAKHFLGFKPLYYNFSDPNRHEYLKPYTKNWERGITIERAIEYLQRQGLPISKALNEIEIHRIQALKNSYIEEDRWIRYAVGKRLGHARNPMLHGEQTAFSEMGHYLLMLYILFYLHDNAQS